MKNIIKSICCVVFCSLLSTGTLANAQSDFDAWKQQFYQEALHAGVSQKTLDKAVPRMKLLERVIELDTQKPEYVSDFFSYTGKRLSDTRIQNGRKMKATYPTWLNRVEQKYGVPKAYLLALWGMETNYGSFMGSVNMLDSLATLAYYPRRRQFFTNELIAYLKIMDKEGSVAPQTGSWDGGFGHFQFMPTTFLAYAVDGDGNGRRDIVNNMPDAFASAANYLHAMGWNPDEPWGREVVVPDGFDWLAVYQAETLPVSEWAKMGLKPRHLKAFPANEMDIRAEWRAPMGKNGPVFLTYPNTKIIMRWNKLSLYALSVGLLADVIEEQYERPAPPDDFKPMKTAHLMCLQDALKTKGLYQGEADGLLGPKTRAAIRSYQQELGHVVDGYPSPELLTKMECQNDEN